MRRFAVTNDLSGVIKRTSATPGATIITKVSEAEAKALAAIPRYFTATVDPNPGTDNTFKIAFSNAPVRGKYAFGTVVTITKQAGFAISSVLVNGEEVEEADNAFTFTITEPVDIAVTTLELFTVTLDPTTGNFTATYDTEAIGGKYVTGTTVTIAAAEGSEITALTANATPVDAEVDGYYIVTITANTTIAITTAEVQAQG